MSEGRFLSGEMAPPVGRSKGRKQRPVGDPELDTGSAEEDGAYVLLKFRTE